MTDKQASFINFLARKAGFRNATHAWVDFAGVDVASDKGRITCRDASGMIDWLKAGATPEVETV